MLKNIKNKVLVLLMFFFIGCLFSYSQTGHLNIVKKNYPHVYATISESLYKQWPDAKNDDIRLIAMEGQAKVFLEVAEQIKPVDEEAMTQAILKNSLEGQREYNQKIIEDTSIENPFTLLSCDWYRVKSDYYNTRRQGTRLPTTIKDTPATNTNKVLATKSESQPIVNQTQINNRDEHYTSVNREYTSDRNYINKWSSNYGVKVALGGASFNVDDKFKEVTGLDSKLSFSAEVGVMKRFQKNNFFIQGDLSVQMVAYEFKDNDHYSSQSNSRNEYSYKSTFGYIKAQVYAGINTRNEGGVNFIAGVGPFVAYQFNLDGKFYYNYYWERIYGDDYYDSNIHDQIGLRPKTSDNSDLRKIDFGLSAMLGIEVNDLQFTIQPNVGLTNLNKYGLGVKTLSVQLSTAFFF